MKLTYYSLHRSKNLITGLLKNFSPPIPPSFFLYKTSFFLYKASFFLYKTSQKHREFITPTCSPMIFHRSLADLSTKTYYMKAVLIFQLRITLPLTSRLHSRPFKVHHSPITAPGNALEISPFAANSNSRLSRVSSNLRRTIPTSNSAARSMRWFVQRQLYQ